MWMSWGFSTDFEMEDMEGLKLVFVNFMAGFSGDFLTGKSLAGACLSGGI